MRNLRGFDFRPALRPAFIGLLAFAAAPMALAADLPSPVPKTMPAEAATPSIPIDFLFGTRFQTDYNFRGISQSDRRPSLQGYFEVQGWDNFVYAGIAALQTRLPTRPDAEIDLTAGIRPKFGPFTFDFGVIHYFYPNETQLFFAGAPATPPDTDFTEAAGKVSFTLQEVLTLGGNVFYTPDWLGSGASATYASVTAKYLLPEAAVGAGWSVSGELGRYTLGRVDPYLGGINLPDYTYWNAGIAYNYKNFTVDLRYHDTDLSRSECYLLTTDPRGLFSGSGRSRWCDATFVATLQMEIQASSPGIFAASAGAPPSGAPK
jgi:uncharacterized protein (TIGR02001 family)